MSFDPTSPDLPERRVILARHGHYERIGDLGDEAWGLSPLGRKQASRLGARLQRTISAMPGQLEGLYASPWPRALQTAEIVAQECGLPTLRIKPYLRECVPIVPELDPVLERMGLVQTTREEHEATVAQVERVENRFLAPSRRATTYVVVCHGNLIRYLVARTLGLPLEAWMQLECHHASLTEIRVYPGPRRAIIRYNDTGHLPPEMVSAV